MKVSILCTDIDHPVNPWLARWAEENSRQHKIQLARNSNELVAGDILFLVSCHEIIGQDTRIKFEHSLVLHASPLPMGRGMSPHIWQILEGKNELTLTLLNAEDKLDSGNILTQIPIQLDGCELYDEINAKIFDAELNAMTWALENIDSSTARAQVGEASFYRKRTPEDSRLDPEKTISEQFNLLRISDPYRYPAFFELNGCRYKIRLEKF